MDYIDGMSLKEHLLSRGGKIPYDEALRILLPVMDALSRVHELKLLHRDVSPDNICLTRQGESKLLDFGAARFALDGDKSVSVILKHGYAPEEQYRSHGGQGPWTDVYAMGATLYNCITGELPPDSLERLHEDKLLRPSQMGIQLPPEAEEAILMALAVKAEDRFSNMKAMMGALTGASSGQAAQNDAATSQPGAQTSKPYTYAKNVGMITRLKANKKLLIGLCGAGVALLLAIILPLALNGKNKATVVSAVSAPQSSPSAAVPAESEAPASPSITAPIADPAVQLRLEPYSNDALGFSLDVVKGYEIAEDAENGIVTMNVDGAALVIGYYAYAGTPLYSLEDYAKNSQDVLAYITDKTKPVIITKGYTTVNSVDAYGVEYEEESAEGMFMMVMGRGEFGAYLLGTAIRKGLNEYDDRLNELFAMMDSFTVTGPAQTTMAMFKEKELGFKFLYDTALCEGGYKIQKSEDSKVPCVFLYPVDENENNVIEIENAEPYAAAPEEALEYLDKAVKENFTKENDASYKEAGSQTSDAYGNYQVFIRGYELSIPKRDYWAVLSSMRIDGQTFAIGAFYDDSYEETVIDVTKMVIATLRPL